MIVLLSSDTVYYYKSLDEKFTSGKMANMEKKVTGEFPSSLGYVGTNPIQSYEKSIISGSVVLLAIFFAIVFKFVFANGGKLFLGRFGRTHRIVGAVYLCVLLLGVIDLKFHQLNHLVYDVTLGITGTVLTLTAANDFRSHKHVKNVASGILEKKSTVSYTEMVEHSFYQMLNLFQAIYLHAHAYILTNPTSLSNDGSEVYRYGVCLGLLVFVTMPWNFRYLFPINKFSANYNTKSNPKLKESSKPFDLLRFLYRLKKQQYLLYKHFLLHGLNISVLLSTLSILDKSSGVAIPIVQRQYFRLYWMALNSAYTMEFFLQTLVKRNYMAQQTMVNLNQFLMFISSIAAFYVTLNVNILIGTASLVLNFIHRGHEMINVLGISLCSLVLIKSF